MDLITSSIVVYNSEITSLKLAVDSVLHNNVQVKLFIIDNSKINTLEELFMDDRVIYIHNPTNPGFGAAHNIAIRKAIDMHSSYHFIVNPDIYYHGDIMMEMVDYMKNHKTIGMIMPQVLNVDGSVQNLPKLLPRPTDILWRKFKKPIHAYNKFIDKYELRFVPTDITYNAPVLSGCFTLLNLEAIIDVGMYDDRFFMYFEDWDLSRRMHQKYKTIYFPNVSVYHGYESGANKSSKLFKIFVKSAITYFNKWGWFLDKERSRINNSALNQF